MILHREGTSRRAEPATLPRSVPELGRALRRERTRQGLRVDEVSARTGLPPVLLDALEAGTVDRLPDQVQTVKTLRGYADALGLDGDRYALLLIDLWPSYGGGPPVVVVQQGGSLVDVSGSVPLAAGTAAGATSGDTAAAPAPAVAPDAGGGPEPGRSGDTVVDAPPAIRRIGGTTPAPEPGTAQVPLVLADTGVNPAVPAVAHRARNPWPLRVVAVVVVAVLVLAVAGLVLHREKPQWLHDIGIGAGPRAAGGAHAATTTVTSLPFTFGTEKKPTSTEAVFAVHEPTYEVKVVAVGGSSWLQASDGSHGSPIYTGELAAGAVKIFSVTQARFTLQVGSTSARVFVAAGLKPIGFYFPQNAPFTMVFNRRG